MTDRASTLSSAALCALANAVERGTLAPPYGAMQVGRSVAEEERPLALEVLRSLHADGLAGRGLARALRLAEAARRAAEAKPAPSLVWSDLDLAGSRDTSVVCHELFRAARERVIVSTYNLGHRGRDGAERGNPVLRPLADRMAAVPGLSVRMFINLRRVESMSTASDRAVEASFVAWFRRDLWPWDPLPELYYDPRSLRADGEDSACLHAKCVVVDDARALVTSANLTEAAHGRNIEAGVLLDDPVFARTLRCQFESLIDRGYVRRLNLAAMG